VAALALLPMLMLAACGADSAAPTPASVVVLGDSITFASADAIRSQLAAVGVGQVTVDAEIGRRIAVGTGATGGPRNGIMSMQALLDAGTPGVSDAGTWVIALGTNDVGQYGSLEEAMTIGQLLALVPADATLVWVDTCMPGRKEQSDRFNTNLNAVLDERPRTTIGRWSEVCAEPGLLLDDLVHPTAAGQDAFAKVITDAISPPG
jgi:lysophospholipase L1-like esterase